MSGKQCKTPALPFDGLAMELLFCSLTLMQIVGIGGVVGSVSFGVFNGVCGCDETLFVFGMIFDLFFFSNFRMWSNSNWFLNLVNA